MTTLALKAEFVENWLSL